MPSILIVRRKCPDSFEILLQRRSGFINYPYHWCSPGGSFETVELAVYKDESLTPETRQAAALRAALREVIEECGGGSFVGSHEPSGFSIEPLDYYDRRAPAQQYDNCVLPPGMLRILHEPNVIRPLVGNKSSQFSSQMFVYLMDSSGLDKGWAENWIPRARGPWRNEIDENYHMVPNVQFGYTWVPLEHILASPLRPVPGSTMPLVNWDQKWFSEFAGELLGHIAVLQQQQSLVNCEGENLDGPAEKPTIVPLPLPIPSVSTALSVFVDEIQNRGIRVVAFDFDGVMLPGDSNWYQGVGLHPLSHGFLALADELDRRGLYMAVVSNNNGGNIRNILSKGQPSYMRPFIAQLAQRSNIFNRLLSDEIAFAQVGEEYLPTESYDSKRNFLGSNRIRKNGKLRLLCHRAKLQGTLDGSELFDNGIGARSTLLIDDRESNCEKWQDIGGHTYIPSNPNEVGLEVDLSIQRLQSPRLWFQNEMLSEQLQDDLKVKRAEAISLSNIEHWDEWVRVWRNENKAAGNCWIME